MEIQNPGNIILVSPASYWEIAIKISTGKYRLIGPYEEFWRVTMQQNRIDILPIGLHHTAMLTSLTFHHKDPFDRLLIAQSLVEQIPVVSSDELFDAYGVSRVW